MKNFPLMAAAFEGGLVALAIVLGWLLGVEPLATFRFEPYDAALALAATLPPLTLFWVCVKYPFGPLKQIAQLIDEMVVPLFRECGLIQLAVIAALAGLGEEMIFRGVVQTALAEWLGGETGPITALAISAVLFGMLHAVTPTYALLAAIIGLYLGWLWMEMDNLLVPVVVHGLYDFAALTYLVKTRPNKAP